MTNGNLFHWADYLVFAIFLVISSAIGFWVAWRDRNSASNKDYLVAGRTMHWIPASLSMQAAFLSAVSVLATPVEIYYFGTMFSYIAIGCGFAFPVAAHLFLGFFYKLNLISSYEYLEMRYNKTVRIVGALTFFVMVILYNSILLYTPAIALAQVTGLSIDVSILMCGSICTIYTFSGGMKGTIWIDSMQVLIIFIGFIILIIFGSIRVGGLTRAWEVSQNGGRVVFDDFNLDPTTRTTFWTQTISTFFSSISLWAASQTMIQKFLSIKSLNDAYKATYVNSFTNLLFIIMATIVGIITYAFYEGCDPQMSGKINKFDQIVPLLVMELTSHLPGIPGIFIATIFSASLSSLSGALTAMSAVTMYDFVLPAYEHAKGHVMNDKMTSVITKLLVLVFGIVAIGSGYLAQYMGDSILQITISISGFVGGPLSSLVVMGVCFPFVNSWGALSGLIISLTISTWMVVGSVIMKQPLSIMNVTVDKCLSDFNHSLPLTHAHSVYLNVSTAMNLEPKITTTISWFYRISHYHYGLIALIVAIVVAVPVSLITGRQKNIDSKLTYKFIDKCCGFCCPHYVKSCVKYPEEPVDAGHDDDAKNKDVIPLENLIIKEEN